MLEGERWCLRGGKSVNESFNLNIIYFALPLPCLTTSFTSFSQTPRLQSIIFLYKHPPFCKRSSRKILLLQACHLEELVCDKKASTMRTFEGKKYYMVCGGRLRNRRNVVWRGMFRSFLVGMTAKKCLTSTTIQKEYYILALSQPSPA